MNEPFATGTRVIIWGRPDPNLILLFGEGTYEGNTFINGMFWPTVRLTNGREITVHYQGVSIGQAETVGETCKRFSGDVLQWDLDKFLQGEIPTQDQRTKSIVTGAVNSLPPPKTATDKVMYLKREIELEENKKILAQQLIDASNKSIAIKKAEMQQLTNAVIAELAAINPDIIKLVAEQVAALNQVQPTAVNPPTNPTWVGHLTPKKLDTLDELKNKGNQLPDEDHTKLAVED